MPLSILGMVWDSFVGYYRSDDWKRSWCIVIRNDTVYCMLYMVKSGIHGYDTVYCMCKICKYWYDTVYYMYKMVYMGMIRYIVYI